MRRRRTTTTEPLKVVDGSPPLPVCFFPQDAPSMLQKECGHCFADSVGSSGSRATHSHHISPPAVGGEVLIVDPEQVISFLDASQP